MISELNLVSRCAALSASTFSSTERSLCSDIYKTRSHCLIINFYWGPIFLIHIKYFSPLFQSNGILTPLYMYFFLKWVLICILRICCICIIKIVLFLIGQRYHGKLTVNIDIANLFYTAQLNSQITMFLYDQILLADLCFLLWILTDNYFCTFLTRYFSKNHLI